MPHVNDRLARWLGGELDEAASAVVASHLAACADCRREADALRAVWQALDAAAPQPAAGSVWPAVQARTRRQGRGWFFAGRPAAQGALAAAAVACGLVAAVLLPTRNEATAADTTLWAEASRVLDDESTGTLEIWLEPGAEAQR
ncbi:MAG: zf-HC2 domain-containing protein [Candidatus Krumholzibacteriia bacterium]